MAELAPLSPLVALSGGLLIGLAAALLLLLTTEVSELSRTHHDGSIACRIRERTCRASSALVELKCSRWHEDDIISRALIAAQLLARTRWRVSWT